MIVYPNITKTIIDVPLTGEEITDQEMRKIKEDLFNKAVF